MDTLNRCVARLLIVCLLAVGMPMPMPANAAIVGTDQIAAASERDRVRSFLDRQEVRDRLQAFGIESDAAKARVDALTDDEASALAAHIDQAPAGGILGAILLIFFVLLVTDILGFTKVFPFTRSAR